MPDSKSPEAKAREGGVMSGPSEFVDLLKRYVLQETVGPLKTIGRTLGIGLASAFAFGVASVLALIGVLRVLQTETGSWFTGNLTWLPYVITLGAGLVIIAIAGLIVLRSPKPASRPPAEAP
jgi:hypothetical protein